MNFHFAHFSISDPSMTASEFIEESPRTICTTDKLTFPLQLQELVNKWRWERDPESVDLYLASPSNSEYEIIHKRLENTQD